VACAVLAWGSFAAASPLWLTYLGPNNFTNHSAFQDHYTPTNWQQSPERDLISGRRPSIGADEVPGLYLESDRLKGVPGIIEYPMLIGDHVNIYFYYQHFHRRPVRVGYLWSNSMEAPETGDFAPSISSIDVVMENVPEPPDRSPHWHTMVKLEDGARLRREFKGWLVVVHRNPLADILHENYPDDPLSSQAVQTLTGNFGEPVYADDRVAAWIVD
jgi:hypothetical protein